MGNLTVWGLENAAHVNINENGSINGSITIIELKIRLAKW